MRAAILAVGSELLGDRRLDTNSLFLTAALRRFGVDLGYKAVIDDAEERIAAEVARLAAEVDLVIVTGGLGPTADDVTREAVAAAFRRGLRRRPELVDELRRRFAEFGFEMPVVNEKQGDVIDGAEVLANRRGTAPGQRLDTERGAVFLIPGVPTEARGMLEDHLEPWLRRHAGEAVTESRVLKLACVPESSAEAGLEPFYAEFGRQGFSVLPSVGEIALQLTASGSAAQRERWLEPRTRRLRALFPAEVFFDGDGDDLSLAAAVGGALVARGATVVTAESCTGGLIAQRLTETPGSSAYFLGAVVSYANEVKTSVLGVDAETLDRQGAVSEAVVMEMARGARRLLGGDYAIAASGVAGPGGGSAEKPVGTVHLAIVGDGSAVHRRLRLPGDRERVRWLASQWALDLLRRQLLATQE